MTPALFAYRLATYAMSPFLGFVLRARAKSGKEDYLRLHERYAKRLPPRRPGPLIWLHGASVGESGLLLELGRPTRDLAGANLVPNWQPVDLPAQLRRQLGAHERAGGAQGQEAARLAAALTRELSK